MLAAIDCQGGTEHCQPEERDGRHLIDPDDRVGENVTGHHAGEQKSNEHQQQHRGNHFDRSHPNGSGPLWLERFQPSEDKVLRQVRRFVSYRHAHASSPAPAAQSPGGSSAGQRSSTPSPERENAPAPSRRPLPPSNDPLDGPPSRLQIGYWSCFPGLARKNRSGRSRKRLHGSTSWTFAS